MQQPLCFKILACCFYHKNPESFNQRSKRFWSLYQHLNQTKEMSFACYPQPTSILRSRLQWELCDYDGNLTSHYHEEAGPDADSLMDSFVIGRGQWLSYRGLCVIEYRGMHANVTNE